MRTFRSSNEQQRQIEWLLLLGFGYCNTHTEHNKLTLFYDKSFINSRSNNKPTEVNWNEFLQLKWSAAHKNHNRKWHEIKSAFDEMLVVDVASSCERFVSFLFIWNDISKRVDIFCCILPQIWPVFCIIIIIIVIVRRLFLILISTFFASDFVQIIWFDIKYHHSDRLTINDHSKKRTMKWMMCKAKGELSARFTQRCNKYAHAIDRHTKRKEKTHAEWEWNKKQEQKQLRQQQQQPLHWTSLHHLWRHSFVSAFKFSTNQSILASA